MPRRSGPTGHLNRVPPHDLNTERDLLGAAMLRAEAAALVAGMDPAVFYAPAHGLIAGAIRSLVAAGSPVDVGTVAAELRATGQLDAVGGEGRAGSAYLLHCIADTPATASAPAYAGYVVGYARSREMLRLAAEVVEATYGGLPVDGLLGEMAKGAAEAELAQESSWDPANLAMTLAGEGTAAVPAILRRVDGVPLLYPAKVHALNGESESGKSWLAMVACVEAMADGRHVIYIDFEAGPVDVVERLLGLGATPAVILERFHYIRPEDPVDASARLRMLVLLAATEAAVVVLDGFTEALALSGWDENSGADIAAFYGMLARPIARRGPCVILIDHLVKDREKQGNDAAGSRHKRAGIDGATFKVELVKPFARGATGVARLVVTKDRHGFVRQCSAGARIAGELHLSSDPDNGAVRAEIRPVAEVAMSALGIPRRTRYMERVSQALEQSRVPVNRSWVEREVGGNARRLRDALDVLVAEGWAREEHHGQARLFQSVRPFRENGDPVLSEQEDVSDHEMF